MEGKQAVAGFRPADFLDRNMLRARQLTRYAQEETPIFDRLADEWMLGQHGNRVLPDVVGALLRVPDEALDRLSAAAVGTGTPEAGKPMTAKRRQPRKQSRAARRARKD